MEIDEPVFFLQDGGKRSLRVVLLARMDGSLLQAAQSLEHQVGSDGGEAWGQGFGRIVGCDGKFFLLENVAGVEAGVNAHGGDAGDSLAMGDGPLNRGRATVFRKQRGVQV